MIRSSIIAVLLVAACDPLGSGISQAEAIEIAGRGSQLQQPVLLDIHQERRPDLQHGGETPGGRDSEDRVWVVSFTGTLEICRPAPGGCDLRSGMATVYLDYTSGEYLGREATAPAIPDPT